VGGDVPFECVFVDAAVAPTEQAGGDVSFECVRSMVVSGGGANLRWTTFVGDHGMLLRILGGLRFLATSRAVGGECVEAIFCVLPLWCDV
jgi:hypothetical protein